MRFFLCLLLLVSCAHKVTSDGGQVSYDSATYEALSPEDMPTYAQTVVKRETRDPENVTLEQFRTHPAGQIRRIGLVLLETEFQPSRSGLASDRNLYLSARGKQILTEQQWIFWNSELRRLSKDGLTWPTREELVTAKSFSSAGSPEPDYILKFGDRLAEADLLWKAPGERIASETLLRPAGFRDLSLVLIPAYDLMGGPKPSQHQHHWVNDLCKELRLDAVVIVSVGAEWRRGAVDKRTKEVIPEEMKIRAQATVLYPWSTYHTIGATLGLRNLPKVNVPLASYDVRATLPVQISVPESEENLATAFDHVINPVRRHYMRLGSLVQERIISDLLQTHQGP